MRKIGICAVACLMAFAVLLSSVYFVYATDTEQIDEAKLAELLMADRFDFMLPSEEHTNLLQSAVEHKGSFADLTNQTRMQVLYNEGGRIDIGETAYLTYKLTNRSSRTLSIGTMVYFRTTGGNLCAYVLIPMVYDAQTGERLNYKTSYEYTSGKYVLSNVMPTVEIPAGKEVFIAIPFTSVNDAQRYVPGVVLADDEKYSAGTMPTRGCLWSNNAERTALLEEKLARDGTTDCLQMQFSSAATDVTARETVRITEITIFRSPSFTRSQKRSIMRMLTIPTGGDLKPKA